MSQSPPDREEARARLHSLRNAAVVASGVGFLALLALAATDAVGVTAKAQNSASGSAPSSAAPSSSQSSGGGFFSNSGSSGLGSNSAPAAPAQAPLMSSGGS
ncbi:MAG TPA: hypothetical protein VNI34_07250 [Candidatus Nitrosotalea sp.]|nr:hypothetical protein [Candidatus Nitrosotalea sp.]